MLAPHSTLLSGIFFNSTEQFRDVVNSREVRRAVLSQAPMILAPMRRFFFAGEQQDLRHSSRSHPRFDRPGSRGLGARCSIRPNSPPCRLKGAPWVAPLFRFSDSRLASEQNFMQRERIGDRRGQEEPSFRAELQYRMPTSS